MRDQANKTLDLYLQRVRKYGSNLADTVLPPPTAVDAASANNPNAARIGTSNDTSWAGWAISSFTNKLTAAKGEIQPTSNGGKPVVAEPARPSSVPRPPQTSPAETLGSSRGLNVAAPSMIRASSDIPIHTTTLDEPEEDYNDTWGADAWGAGEEEESQAGSKEDEDTFFDGTTSPAATPAPAAVPYDDGGEPDFAGWLAAQSKAKTKKPLPKGLGKSASAKEVPTCGSAAASRTSSAGTLRSSKPAAPAKIIDTKPKDEGEEDGWGDAW